jgi:flagellar assembly protein FliH
MAEGHAKALAELKTRLQEIEARWMTAVTEFEAARDRMLTEARHDLLRLAVRIAERVIKRRIDTDPKVAASQLEAVLTHILRPSRLTVLACPDDLPALREAMPTLCARFSAAAHVELQGDPSLPRGSCVARTLGGEIDASIWTQLDRVADTLLDGGLTRDGGPGQAPDAAEAP